MSGKTVTVAWCRAHKANPSRTVVLRESLAESKVPRLHLLLHLLSHPPRMWVPHPPDALVFVARVGNHEYRPVFAIAFALAFPANPHKSRHLERSAAQPKDPRLFLPLHLLSCLHSQESGCPTLVALGWR